MRPVQSVITIDASRERLFELVGDLAVRPSFCDHFQHEFRLERIDSRGVGAAARFRVDARGLPIWMETLIDEVDAPHRVSERGAGGRLDRIPIFTVWELNAGAGNETEVSVTFWTEPANPLDAGREHLGAAGYYRRQWKRALRRLKELAETGAEVAPVAVAGASRLPS